MLDSLGEAVVDKGAKQFAGRVLLVGIEGALARGFPEPESVSHAPREDVDEKTERPDAGA